MAVRTSFEVGSLVASSLACLMEVSFGYLEDMVLGKIVAASDNALQVDAMARQMSS